MGPGQDGPGDGTLTWAHDAAADWLTQPAPQAYGTEAGAESWLLGEPTPDDPGADEAEIAPALAAIIPAVISAAPAIISLVQQLTSKPKPAPVATTQPPPTPPPAQQTPAPRPAPRPAPTPTPATPPAPAGGAPTSGTGAVDLLQQLAALLPRIVDLVTTREGREWLEAEGGGAVEERRAPGWPTEQEHTEHAEAVHAHTEQTQAGHAHTGHVQAEHAHTELTHGAHRGTAERSSAEASEGSGAGTAAYGARERSGDEGQDSEGDATGRGPPGAVVVPGPTAPARRVSSATLVPVPDRTTLNVGVSPCPTSLLVARYGRPRDLVTHECQAITSPFWAGRMVTGQVGRSRVRGHRQAVALFADAFAALEQEDPELWARVGSSGMLCVRHARGRPDDLSNHALGLAIDVTLDGHVDIRGDGQVQAGLVTLHDVLGRSGIFWGAALRPEDAVHYEVGAEVVHRWIDEGLF